MLSRIQELLDDQQMNMSEFAKFAGISKSTMSFIKQGREPSMQVIKSIKAAFPKVRYDWLISGEGSMYGEGVEHQEESGSGGEVDLFSNEHIFDDVDSVSERRLDEDGKVEGVSPEEIVKDVQSKVGRKAVKMIVFYSDGSYEELMFR